jgi:DNA-binding MltR family transcriptional regulator
MPRSDARKKLLDELPSAEAMVETIASLRLMEDAAAILMGAAYLDHALELLLKAEFRQMTPDEERRMFDGSQNGILGTFTAKIRMVYALGWLVAEAYHDLLLINDMRNTVAHSLHKHVDFTNEYIMNDCSKLQFVKWLAAQRHEERGSYLPSFVFVETVQQIYSEFRVIVLSKRIPEPPPPLVALTPSPNKPRRRNRRRNPTTSE